MQIGTFLNYLIKDSKTHVLNEINSQRIMILPMWDLINGLDIFKDCQTINLEITNFLKEKLINIHSSIIPK